MVITESIHPWKNFVFQGNPMRLPKKIYLCWWQGLEKAPPIVCRCIDEWRRLNPEWEVVVLDKSAALKVLDGFPIDLSSFYQIQAISDILRVKLLLDGGVWADATTFPTIPLDEWIAKAVFPSGFFAFDGHREPLDISSWFLAANPDNPIITHWWEQVTRFWQTKRRMMVFKESGGFERNYDLDPMIVSPGQIENVFPFFWVMYLFTYLLRTNKVFKRHWDDTPRMSGANAHELQFGIQSGSAEIGMIDVSPVHKLTWKSDVFTDRFFKLIK